MKKVIVVGGGLIGLFSSLYAAHRGFDVTLLEGHDEVGAGASRGNAGEICPSLADPLPGPGMIQYGLKNSFKSDAALHVALPPSAPLLMWLARFARHSNNRTYDLRFRASADLALRSQHLFGELEGYGVETSISRAGNLRCFRSTSAAIEERDSIERLRSWGVGMPGELLSGESLRDIEPILSREVEAGYHLRDQWFVDPGALVDDLRDVLVELGVSILTGERVTSVREIENPSCVEVLTQSGRFVADAAVVAAGAWSGDLLRAHGLRNAFASGKGYSFSVRTEKMPTHVINLPSANAVATPLDDRLRIAGTMEFDGSFDTVNMQRVERIVRAASPYLVGIDWTSLEEVWVGPRPMTVDGLPYIDRLGKSGRIIVAAGHNMLGLTLAPGTGEIVCDLLEGAAAPNRFFTVRRSYRP